MSRMDEYQASPVAEPARLLDSLGHAVIATDLQGIIHFWSPSAARLYGWTAEEAIGLNIANVTVPQISEELSLQIMASLGEGGEWSGGFTVQRKDGSTFPALVTDTCIVDGSGQLIGIVGVSTDLGVALRPLLARSSDAALVLTPEGRISYVSPAASGLFGWSPDRILGAMLWDLVDAPERSPIIAHFRQVAARPTGLGPFECQLVRADGSRCWAEILMTNMLGDPAVSGVVCNLRDTTERRKDRAELVRLAEQLQYALTSRIVIEQAKGYLSAKRGITPDAAFEDMRRTSRATQVKMHDVARRVLTGADLA
jgi:PAS domain S-box-containing protein